MTKKLQNLEKAVSELTASELRQFTSWFADFEQAAWERELEDDAASGRLDFLVREGKKAYKDGTLREL